MRCRTRGLVLALSVVLAAAGCSGSDGGSVEAGAPSSSTTPTTVDSPSVSTNGSTTTAPASMQCKARADRALKPGATDALTLQSGGMARTYRRFIPTTLNPSVPAPLVLDLHGLNSPIGAEVLVSDFEAKAEEVGAIVLTPLGGSPGPGWNVVRDPSLPDDVGFLSDLITATESAACVDPSRIFAIGMSNGAQMASQLACSLGDRIAAFGAVAGLTFPPGCTPARPVPIIAFHGTADLHLAFQGGLGPEGEKLIAGAAPATAKVFAALDLAPIPTVAARWAAADGCAMGGDEAVTAHVRRQQATSCSRGAAVELYEVEGGGHSWPGSGGSARLSALLGPTTMEIDADDLIWSFFEDHPLSG